MRLLPFFALFLLFAPLLVPGEVAALALNLDYPTVGPFGGIDLDCKDSNAQCGQELSPLLAWLYYFVVGVASLAAFLLIVWAGFQWLASAGNPAKIADARDRIGQAILGLVLVLGSFLVVQFLAPEFVELKLFSPKVEDTGGSLEETLLVIGGVTLQDLADQLCELEGGVPTDVKIRSYLTRTIGSGNYSEEDIRTLATLMEESASCEGEGPPSIVVEGLLIDQTTVPEALCVYPDVLGGAGGILFDPVPYRGLEYIIRFFPGTTQPADVLPRLEDNLAFFVPYCAVHPSELFCPLADEASTSLASLTETQQQALAQYCTDILPTPRP